MSEENTKSTGGMSAADTEFLVTCLQHASGGNITIDTKAVAEVLNYGNPKSVANKVLLLKKKYNLPLGGRTGKADAPSSPSSPSPSKVTKKKATPRAKKSAVKVEQEEPTENESEENGEVEDAEDA